MLVEGLNLQLKTSKKSLQFYGLYRSHIAWLNYCIGWLLPFLIVVCAAVTGFLTNTYMEKGFKTPLLPSDNYELCWLDSKSGMRVYAVIIPIGIILLLTMLFLIRSIFFVIKIKKNDSAQYGNNQLRCQLQPKEFSQLQHGLKVVLLLTPVTGITWILLFFTSTYT